MQARRPGQGIGGMVSGMADKLRRPFSSYRAADLGARAPPRRWRLMLGPELVAELAYDSYETPWITVLVTAQPGLEPFDEAGLEADGFSLVNLTGMDANLRY